MLFLFQAEDGIRDLVRSRGLGDVYKRQVKSFNPTSPARRQMTVADFSEIADKAPEKNLLALSLIHI